MMQSVCVCVCVCVYRLKKWLNRRVGLIRPHGGEREVL